MPDERLAETLRQALAARGPSYEPRTRHKLPDGKPKYTNRLILESSPYLLQHAHNPVNWFPWGEEAFRLARELGRPVFLSVGYSTCHWCHVMEEESFEDEQVAAYLNAHYIPVKVDREERPDVDSIYMASVQTLTGRGGWPMSVWLTPERKPYFAGTYFPARDGDRGTPIGFLTLLQHHHDAFRSGDADLSTRADAIARRLERVFAVEKAGDVASAEVIERTAHVAARRFDPVDGGVAGAPKFPSSLPIRVLLRHHRSTGDAKALDMAVTTLTRMAAGGMYDHVAGGFHRYSTDAHWLVPHFEKMLYDNARLVCAYLEGYQATGNGDFARVAREILEYVAREMTSPLGLFYSATDADSVGPQGHREEGYYFTWTPHELQSALSPDEVELATRYYAVTPRGNFEGRSILHTPRSRDDVARELKLSRQQLDAKIDDVREKLRAERERRPPPLRDDKAQASWNGLMTSAFARGALVLGDDRYARIALRAADALAQRLHVGGRLKHSVTHGKLSGNAFLDDYAFAIAGLLDTFEATSEPRLLALAIDWSHELEQYHADRDQGGYFLTASDAETLIAREKPDHDGAIPNGNSLALMSHLRLAELTTDDTWRKRADATLRAFASQLDERPHSLDEMLLGVDFALGRPKEIAIVLPSSAQRADAEPLLDVLRRTFVPNRVLVVGTEAQLAGPLAERVPWAAGKPAKGGKPTAYVCERGTCDLPTSSAAVLAKQLAPERTAP